MRRLVLTVDVPDWAASSATAVLQAAARTAWRSDHPSHPSRHWRLTVQDYGETGPRGEPGLTLIRRKKIEEGP
jgi:hypothetical protein